MDTPGQGGKGCESAKASESTGGWEEMPFPEGQHRWQSYQKLRANFERGENELREESKITNFCYQKKKTILSFKPQMIELP